MTSASSSAFLHIVGMRALLQSSDGGSRLPLFTTATGDSSDVRDRLTVTVAVTSGQAHATDGTQRHAATVIIDMLCGGIIKHFKEFKDACGAQWFASTRSTASGRAARHRPACFLQRQAESGVKRHCESSAFKLIAHASDFKVVTVSTLRHR